jgi:hypothetical protein
LSAKANAEQRTSGVESLSDHCSFFGEEWVSVRLIDPNWPAKHDEKIRFQRVKPRKARGVDIVIMELVTSSRQRRLEDPEILELDMTNSDRGPKHGAVSRV